MNNQHYDVWHSVKISTRRGPFTLFDKPGMARHGQPDVPAALLADEMVAEMGDAMGEGVGQAVLLLNGGQGLPGLAAAAAGAQVTVADANVVAAEAARRAAEANDLSHRMHVVVSGGTRELSRDRAWDIVAVLLPKGKATARQSIWDAYHALKPGGRFYLAGANAEGAKTYLRDAEQLYGNMAVRGYRKGCRVGVAVKPDAPRPIPARFREPWLDHNRFQRFDVQAGAERLTVHARPGVFSWDRLDPGSEAVLAVMEIDAGDQVLDLGCGSGVLGAVAAMRTGQGGALLLDANMNAVVSARRTLAANGIANAEVALSDCAAEARDRTFDVVVTNPPFHQGKATQYDVAYQFIRDAAQVTKPGGRFYLVANRFIPYEDAIRRWFGAAETLHEDGRFKVLLGRR